MGGGPLKDHASVPWWLICATWCRQPLNGSFSPQFFLLLFLFIYRVYQFVTKMNNGWGCALPRRHAKLIIVMHSTRSCTRKRNGTMGPPYPTVFLPHLNDKWVYWRATPPHYLHLLMGRWEKGGGRCGNAKFLVTESACTFTFLYKLVHESPRKAELVPTLHEKRERMSSWKSGAPVSAQRQYQYSGDFPEAS